MADKKITELQLRDNVTDDVNLPSDDGIQSYRVTAAQLKTYILSALSIATGMLQDLAVTTAKIAAGAVTDAKASFTKPTYQIFTSGSGTYTTPVGCTRIEVWAVGGGGGGGGSGTAATGGAGGNGGDTTFGSSLITCGKGNGSQWYNAGTGGTVTVNSPAVAIQIDYGQGGMHGAFGLTSASGGGVGGGPGGGRGGNPGGEAGVGGTIGGGGGGGSASGNVNGGGGGGSAGRCLAAIDSPSSTYSYSVGAGGSSSSGGTSGFGGGGGGGGRIVVKEFYV